MSSEERSTIKVIDHLVEHGWVSLRSMAVLLNYDELRGIYQRQRGRNAIPTIRVGGMDRVYVEDVVEILKNVPADKKPEADIVLSLYRTTLHHQDA